MRTQLSKMMSTLTVSVCLCLVAAGVEAQDQYRTYQTPSAASQASGSSASPSYSQPSRTTMRVTGMDSPSHMETRSGPNRQLLSSGMFMLTAAYVPTAIVRYANQENTSDNLYIPVAGPWLEIAREPVSSDNKALLILSGAFQDLGAFFFVMGLFVPEVSVAHEKMMAKRVQAAPMAGGGNYGMTARGRF